MARRHGTLKTEAQREQERERERQRSRRKREVHACSIKVPRYPSKNCLAAAACYVARHDAEYPLPATRGHCVRSRRPCPFVRCRYNLYLDVSPKTGSIKLNFPDLEVWQMPESCALDVADRGGTTLESVGALMNITRERIRQLEVKALEKLETSPAAAVLKAMHAESGGA